MVQDYGPADISHLMYVKSSYRGGCRKKYMVVARVNVHFSILDEYEHLKNEALLVGLQPASWKICQTPSDAIRSILKRFYIHFTYLIYIFL